MRKIAACLMGLLLFPAVTVSAKPPNKQGLKNYYAESLANSLNACTTCHVTKAQAADPSTFDEHPPHNAFGKRLRELAGELRDAGKPADIMGRIRLVADEDSDGDGVANELEILAGHAPGRADDSPTEQELIAAKKTREEFAGKRTGYPWQPFQPVARPAMPAVKETGWVRNPVDAFIAAERETRGLPHRPEAAKHVLLRRVYLDLIGLVPTPEELRAFLDDNSPDAYERVVEKLLNSPQYGERWGRHWMDVWRYSDWAGWTGGNQIRDSQPHIWRWRDWILESLNADKPYDRMIVEMLAGDELEPTNPDVLRATGYLVRNYKMLSRETWIQDTVKHTAQAFLGTTLDCARCHDHQYDPISQREYYQVRAIFEPHNVRLDRRPGEPDTKKDGVARAFDAEPAAQTFLFVRGDDRNPDKSKPLESGVPALLGGTQFKIEPVSLPLVAHTPEKQPHVIAETLTASEVAVAQARKALDAARTSGVAADVSLADLNAEVAEAQHAALVATIRVERLEDDGTRERDAESYVRAATEAAAAQRWATLLDSKRNLLVAERAVEKARAASDAAAKSTTETVTDKKLQDAAQKAAAELTAAQGKLAEADKALAKVKQDSLLPHTADYTKRPLKVYPATSTGRRLAFARWIADQQNPLTARVAVNHIWLRHFGTALVPSVFDLGQAGRPPSHPALVDWLAAELMEPSFMPPENNLASGGRQPPEARPAHAGRSPQPWSMKHIHRLIVSSATYRMASTPSESALAADPDNQYYWRMNSRRLEAELVRDNVLWVAGQLDQTFGGPDIDHNLGLTSKRRSLYFRHAAEKQMEFLKIFDAASVGECYERKESVVPQQALALANSELAIVQSRSLARSLAARIGSDPAAFASAAFERVLARPATPAELDATVQFLVEQERLFRENSSKISGTPTGTTGADKPAADPAMRAREGLVHALINHNDFVTVR